MRASRQTGILCSILLLFALAGGIRVSGQITPSELEAQVKAGIDPYFVNSNDTVSRYGPGCITRDVLHDKNGNLWLATWHGIIKYDGKDFTNCTLKEALIKFHVLSIFEDKKGNIWFGTARGGVYRYNGNSFTLFTKAHGLADNTVIAMAEDKYGNIWLGTEGGGVSCYNGTTFRNYTTRNGLNDNNVRSILVDKNGKIWLGTMNGVNTYDGSSFSVFRNTIQPIVQVLTLFEDKAGNIWIGGYDGLVRYDGKSFTKCLLNYLTYYFTEDKKGNVWFTQSAPNTHYPDLPCQILYRYNGTAFTKVMEKNGPNDFQIFGKSIDANGDLWFGTMHGLCKYDGKLFRYFCRQ